MSLRKIETDIKQIARESTFSLVYASVLGLKW